MSAKKQAGQPARMHLNVELPADPRSLMRRPKKYAPATNGIPSSAPIDSDAPRKTAARKNSESNRITPAATAPAAGDENCRRNRSDGTTDPSAPAFSLKRGAITSQDRTANTTNTAPTMSHETP